MRLAVGATCDLKEGAAALRGEAAAGWKGKKDTLAVSFCGSPGRLPWITRGAWRVVSFGTL